MAPNSLSIAEAYFEPKAWFRAIYADEDPVGFITLFDDPDTPNYYLWRMMIADSMVVGLGALWIGGTKPPTPDGSTAPVSAIVKLDPATGDALDLLEIGGSGDDEVVVEVAFDHLWATQGLEAVLIKFDAAYGDEVGRVDVGSGAAGIPYPILLTSDANWVVNSTDSQALSFNADTLEFESGITLPTSPEPSPSSRSRELRPPAATCMVDGGVHLETVAQNPRSSTCRCHDAFR